MSTPRSVVLPVGTKSSTLVTSRGRFAALTAHPTTPRRGTAVLVPGFTGSKEDFIALFQPLSAAGFAVVAYDQRGQHETEGPGEPAAYALDELAADLLSIRRATEDRPVHLVGHSFGGLVTRAAVLLDPSAFDSLTLLDSGPAAIGTPRERDRLGLLRMALAEHDLPTIWAAIQALARSDGEAAPVDPAVADFLEQRFLGNSATGLDAKAEHLLTTSDRVDELRATAVRVLVAYGADDEAWLPPVQADMARRLGAACVEIDGAGHSPNVERPVATAKVLTDFWGAGVPPTGQATP